MQIDAALYNDQTETCAWTVTDVTPAMEGVEEPLYDGVPLLTPRQAKGLEFDHVVVVEPALIAEREQGLRHLYVALTRPTKTLVVVHARPLPPALQLAAAQKK